MGEKFPKEVRSLDERMRQAVEVAKAGDHTLTHYPGGFWSRSGSNKHERPWFGPCTIQALVDRGVFVYSPSGDERNTEVTLIEQ